MGISQTKNATIPVEQKIIQYNNGREIFYICRSNPINNFNEDLEYFWYNEYSKIKSTKGGAGGNLLHGKYQFFDVNGNLLTEVNYYAGLQDGISKSWDSSGTVIELFKFNKGKLIYSKFKSNNSDNIIEWNGPALEKGSIKKIYTSYGRLEQTEEMLDGFKFKVTEYYLKGQIKKIYTTGILDMMYDEYIEYYENGKMKLYGKFEDNWKSGEWKKFNEAGILIYSEKHRINRQYTTDNKKISEGGEYYDTNKNEWVRDGLWIWYTDNGEDILSTKEYNYGNEVTKIK